jgi:ABC-type antimicrobial peptide transport system permease subunit
VTEKTRIESTKERVLYLLLRVLIFAVVGFAAGAVVHVIRSAVFMMPSSLMGTCFLTAGYAIVFGGVMAGLICLLRKS